jgi:hypothetical protein
MLVAIECRDRKDVEDVVWVEQLVTKRNDINAAKCIAVSSAGFSKAAIAKAKHHGIEIRLVQNVTDSDVVDWFNGLCIDVKYRNVSVNRVDFVLETGGKMGGIQLADDLHAAFMDNSPEALIFFDREADKWISVQDIIEDWQKQGNVLEDDSYPLGKPFARIIGVTPQPPCLHTRTDKGQFDVSYIQITLDVTMFEERIRVTDLLQYSDEDSPKAYTALARFAIQGHDCCTFYVHRSSDDSAVPSVVVEPHDADFFGRGKFLKP